MHLAAPVDAATATIVNETIEIDPISLTKIIVSSFL